MKNRNPIIYKLDPAQRGGLVTIPTGSRWDLAHNLPEESPGNPMYWLKPSRAMDPRLRKAASHITGTGVCLDRNTLLGVKRNLS